MKFGRYLLLHEIYLFSVISVFQFQYESSTATGRSVDVDRRSSRSRPSAAARLRPGLVVGGAGSRFVAAVEPVPGLGQAPLVAAGRRVRPSAGGGPTPVAAASNSAAAGGQPSRGPRGGDDGRRAEAETGRRRGKLRPAQDRPERHLRHHRPRAAAVRHRRHHLHNLRYANWTSPRSRCIVLLCRAQAETTRFVFVRLPSDCNSAALRSFYVTAHMFWAAAPHLKQAAWEAAKYAPAPAS